MGYPEQSFVLHHQWDQHQGDEHVHRVLILGDKDENAYGEPPQNREDPQENAHGCPAAAAVSPGEIKGDLDKDEELNEVRGPEHIPTGVKGDAGEDPLDALLVRVLVAVRGRVGDDGEDLCEAKEG